MRTTFGQSEQDPELLRREWGQMGFLSLAVAAVFLLSLFFQYLLDALYFALTPVGERIPWMLTLLGFVAQYAVGMPLSLAVFFLVKKDPPKQKKISVPTLLALFAVSLVLVNVGQYLSEIFLGFFTQASGETGENPVAQMSESIPFWLNFIVSVLVAPVMEELFFRRLVIDRLRRYGDGKAILISGILFGLIHGNFYQFFYAAILGILFGLIYCQTGRIRYTVILHMGINFYCGICTQLVGNLLGKLSAEESIFSRPDVFLPFLLYRAVFWVALVAGLFAVRGLAQRVHLSPGVVWLSPKSFCKITLLNPGVWVLAGVLLYLFLLH